MELHDEIDLKVQAIEHAREYYLERARIHGEELAQLRAHRTQLIRELTQLIMERRDVREAIETLEDDPHAPRVVDGSGELLDAVTRNPYIQGTHHRRFNDRGY
jgi:hypothetical protein